MARRDEIDDLLSPAQRRRKEALAQQAKVDASFRPAPYSPSPAPSADELLFGTTDPDLVAAKRTQGGIYSDPDLLKKRMTEDPIALGAELGRQLADQAPSVGRDTIYERESPTGTLEFTNVGDRLNEPGWRQYMKGGRTRPGADVGAPGGGFARIGVGGGEEQRVRRERATALLTELEMTPPSSGEQLRQVARQEPAYLTMADDIGASETIERGRADVANRKISGQAWALIERRLAARATITPTNIDEAGNAEYATPFEGERVIPGTRAEALEKKNKQLKAQGEEQKAQVVTEQAEKAAAKPDQLADLLAQAQTPSGPDAAPKRGEPDPMKSVFGEGGVEGLPIPGFGKVFSYNPKEFKPIGETIPDLSLDPLREFTEGLTFATGGRESRRERERRLAREKRRRG